MPNEDPVASHYASADLAERILAALEAGGVARDALTVDDLASVDAFHIRGRAATEELAQGVEFDASQRVLDVGSGLGGTARFLASTRGCHVTGVDLTATFCDVAGVLSELVGLGARNEFRCGSALELPFDDDSFDVAWTEHVQMNIADKRRFYGEIARVLKPGGAFAFHDICAGPSTSSFAFPVPWAGDASISHLVSVDELRELLASVGFEEQRFEDKTDASVAFFRGALERNRTEGPAPLGLHLLIGPDAPAKFANLLDNAESKRVRVVQAIVRRR